MDPRVMELCIKKWIPVIEEQAKSGMSKEEWCAMHGINRTSFFRWQKRVREYLLDRCEAQPSQRPSSIPSNNKVGFVEKLDTPYYTQVIYTPVVSAGLEHDLFTIPYMNPLIDKSAVSYTIMADILYRKFALGLPFYRQALDYQMQGIALSRQTILNWVGALVPEICEEVYEFMTQLLVGYRYTQCDETYIQVNKDGYGPGHKSFLWGNTSSELTDCPPIIIFCYEETRGTDHLRRFFREFLGYITCDAYISYRVLEEESGGDILTTGCFMHCRRYFAEAFFVQDVAAMSDEELAALPETRALLLIRGIYQEEKKQLPKKEWNL